MNYKRTNTKKGCVIERSSREVTVHLPFVTQYCSVSDCLKGRLLNITLMASPWITVGPHQPSKGTWGPATAKVFWFYFDNFTPLITNLYLEKWSLWSYWIKKNGSLCIYNYLQYFVADTYSVTVHALLCLFLWLKWVSC